MRRDCTSLHLFSRRILGWSAKSTMARSIVLEALGSALRLRQPSRRLLHHSDRGSQYASDDYQKLLRVARVTCSMSRKGNCWDNAPAESFFATLKRELIHQRNFRTRAEAKSAIFEFIESWYNRERLHSSLGYMSPVEFEAANNHQITKMAA
ncbi:MAG: IS3 family transposase [Bacteroidetes bacterium]|nr:IS3 family transposase [Bacteroidota bacterium]